MYYEKQCQQERAGFNESTPNKGPSKWFHLNTIENGAHGQKHQDQTKINMFLFIDLNVFHELLYMFEITEALRPYSSIDVDCECCSWTKIYLFFFIDKNVFHELLYMFVMTEILRPAGNLIRKLMYFLACNVSLFRSKGLDW
jgi:hypothetical protein